MNIPVKCPFKMVFLNLNFKNDLIQLLLEHHINRPGYGIQDKHAAQNVYWKSHRGIRDEISRGLHPGKEKCQLLHNPDDGDILLIFFPIKSSQ